MNYSSERLIPYDDSVLTALEMFPHMRERFPEVLLDSDENPAPYVFFGSVFNYYLRETRATEQVSMLARFLERLVRDGDANLVELLRIEVVPVFIENQENVDRYWKDLGEATRAMLREVNTMHGIPITLPEAE